MPGVPFSAVYDEETGELDWGRLDGERSLDPTYELASEWAPEVVPRGRTAIHEHQYGTSGYCSGGRRTTTLTRESRTPAAARSRSAPIIIRGLGGPPSLGPGDRSATISVSTSTAGYHTTSEGGSSWLTRTRTYKIIFEDGGERRFQLGLG
jgi:hypothetical protein